MIRETELRGRHKGRLGFVLGSGPSLRHVDPAALAPYVTIAVNAAISKFRNAGYFLAQDIGATRWDYYHDLPADCICLLASLRLANHHAHIAADRVCLYSGKLQRTAAGSAVKFLKWMGCDPIVLLGCDCANEDTKRYFWEFEPERKCKRLDREYSPDSAPHNEEISDYWHGFAKANKGINIISASGGSLTAFPQMELSDVLTNYGEKI